MVAWCQTASTMQDCMLLFISGQAHWKKWWLHEKIHSKYFQVCLCKTGNIYHQRIFLKNVMHHFWGKFCNLTAMCREDTHVHFAPVLRVPDVIIVRHWLSPLTLFLLQRCHRCHTRRCCRNAAARRLLCQHYNKVYVAGTDPALTNNEILLNLQRWLHT